MQNMTLMQLLLERKGLQDAHDCKCNQAELKGKKCPPVPKRIAELDALINLARYEDSVEFAVCTALDNYYATHRESGPCTCCESCACAARGESYAELIRSRREAWIAREREQNGLAPENGNG